MTLSSYAMRLDMTLMHAVPVVTIRYICIINRHQYECKAFGRRQYDYKVLVVANMDINIRHNIYECMNI